MTFQFAPKYAEEVANAELANVDRSFMEAGTHIIKIEATICIESKNTGNDNVILEASIVSTDSTEHKPHEPVKHIWQLSGCEKWKRERNMRQIKTVVAASLPADTPLSAITSDIVGKAIDGGDESVLVGALIKVICKKKTSKNGRDYLDYSFLRAPEAQNQEFPSTPPESWQADDDKADDKEGAEPIPF